MLCSIYKITNTINNKGYVGQTWKTIQKRFQEHKRPAYKGCIHLHNALNKYGRDNFTIELLTVCGTQDTADYWERYFITKYNSIDNGYNLRNGGHGDYNVLSKKLSATMKGRPSPLRGRPQPKELVLRRTRGQKGRKKSPEQVAKLVAALTGRKQTPEHIANMKTAQAARAYKHSPETLAKMKGKTILPPEQIIEVQQSDLPIKAICSKYGISKSVVYAYRKRAPGWTKSHHVKLTEDMVKELIVDRQSGMSWSRLGKKYNVSTTTAYNAVNGKSWKKVARPAKNG
jgi:group I intron endonuclease